MLSTYEKNFALGQCWLSDAEAELGLGTILQLNQRSLTLIFTLTGQQRTYSTNTAPLTRVVFAPGETIQHLDGWLLTIERLEEVDSLLIYLGTNEAGEPASILETQLHPSTSFNGPKERLLTGQLDNNKAFMLRVLSRLKLSELALSPLRGLYGPRVSLLPHQLHLAQEVGKRLAPRVLLADEVGLGKTIEAGLILHQQLITGRANRALILVPTNLTHQWLVELLRRFGLPPSIIDQHRLEACVTQGTSPFANTNLALASLDWVTSSPEILALAKAEDWDLLLIDEAHHLAWQPNQPSPAYEAIEELAAKIPGLLLLTATPEQAGSAGFFAQLRLLDPARYPSLEEFTQEQSSYNLVAKALEELAAGAQLSEAVKNQLSLLVSDASQALIEQLEVSTSTEVTQLLVEELTQQLLDRYGTGRVLFRNRRAVVGGFPERLPLPEALELPASYQQALDHFSQPEHQAEACQLTKQAWPFPLLYPEKLVGALETTGHWWQADPRVNWLINKLKEDSNTKFLVICAYQQTAEDLAEALRSQAGILAARFHQGLSLLERDQQAAWFADTKDEGGSQVLVCSEIGSEGRNFQFAHNLVLFDLPAHPDLIEQRIGRLDRLGQTYSIKIHVPYFSASPQAAWFNWCDAGINLFSQPQPVAASLYQQLLPQLGDYLTGRLINEEFIISSQEAAEEAKLRLEEGRNRLLDLAAPKAEAGQQLVAQIAGAEGQEELKDYLNLALDVYRINSEDLSEDTWYLKPGAEADTSIFSQVHFDLEEGNSGTFNRELALSREDLLFFTWEHPLVVNCLENATSSLQGNASVSVLTNRQLPTGTLLLEAFYQLDLDTNSKQLPTQSLRLLLDAQGKNLAEVVAFKPLAKQLKPLKTNLARQVVRGNKAQIQQLIDQANKLAEAEEKQLKESLLDQLAEIYTSEIDRLEALKLTNPNVRQAEIDQLKYQGLHLSEAVLAAQIRLDALRLIVTSQQ